VEEAATKLEPQPDKVQYYPTHDKPLMQQVKEQLYQHDIVQLRLDKKHFGDLLSSAINRELNSLSNLRYIKPTGKIGKLPKLVSDVNPQIVVGDIDNDNVPVTVEAHLNWGGMFGFRKNADLTIDLPIRVDELELLDTRDLNIEITHNSSSASDLAETVKEILSKGNLMLTLGQSIFGQFITEIQESGIRITDKPKFGISGGQVLITLTKFSRRELNNESTDLVGE
jgi:hypothetical protein